MNYDTNKGQSAGPTGLGLILQAPFEHQVSMRARSVDIPYPVHIGQVSESVSTVN
jgi:hypothetical protein